jgi:3-methyladenine DNA glycosylase AlkC
MAYHDADLSMAEPLKTQFGAAIPRRLSDEVARAFPAFKRDAFLRDALRGFDDLELLDRGRHLGRVLAAHLPAHFPAAVDILLATLPDERSPEGGMASFYYLPHTEFVRAFGLAHFDDAMRALHALTQRFTGEFAIRPFLEHHQAATLERLHDWTRDPSDHVRRLVSEGTRPRLPWAPRLRAFQQDPTPVLALLEKLRDDPALYVRRSVANNLNDIGKDHPGTLVQTAREWLKDASPERQWVVQHALRSAVKRGDPAALKALGYGAASTLEVTTHAITPRRPAIGGRVVVECTLRNASRRTQHVIVDLIVHFVKASGSTSPKVFKLAVVDVAAGQEVSVRKTISLAQLSTRTHYAGKHRVELQLNGAVQALGTFTLTE